VKSIIADAYQYVNDYNSTKFDMVFMDVNYEEDNLEISPPMKFLQTEFLRKLTVSLGKNLILKDLVTADGFVTFNLLSYDKETTDRVFGMIAEVPKSHKYYIEGEEEVNRVIHITKS
jgi:spermidine synthase